MEMITEKAFKAAGTKLRTLDPEQKPEWGIMSPQHMVEHIVGSWRISNGRAQVKAMLSDVETEKRRDFLFSDKVYPQNISNPLFKDGLLPLRKANLSEAIDQLENEIDAFFEYHKTKRDAVEMHPVFGPLDYDGWIRFQSKHMGHHFAQFGLSL